MTRTREANPAFFLCGTPSDKGGFEYVIAVITAVVLCSERLEPDRRTAPERWPARELDVDAPLPELDVDAPLPPDWMGRRRWNRK